MLDWVISKICDSFLIKVIDRERPLFGIPSGLTSDVGIRWNGAPRSRDRTGLIFVPILVTNKGRAQDPLNFIIFPASCTAYAYENSRTE
jgi:hypothetical protein